VACRGGRRGAYRNLVENPEGNRQFGRPGRRLEGNIKVVLQRSGMRKQGLDCSGSG
jgi:hypothetical protein